MRHLAILSAITIATACIASKAPPSKHAFHPLTSDETRRLIKNNVLTIGIEILPRTELAFDSRGIYTMRLLSGTATGHYDQTDNMICMSGLAASRGSCVLLFSSNGKLFSKSEREPPGDFGSPVFTRPKSE